MKKTDMLKYTVKMILSHILYYAGILNVYKKIKLRNKAVVLMYHRVLPHEIKTRSFSHDGIIVDKTTFEKHIHFLKSNFKVLSLKEFRLGIENKTPFKSCSCLITFDDGWRDNYTWAFPVLGRYELPAVIFLSANYIESTDQFWQERLSELLFDVCRLSREQPDISAKYYIVLDKYNFNKVLTLSGEELRSAIHEITGQCKKYSYDYIEKMISELSAAANAIISKKENHDTFMNWNQIKQMANAGITFGSHTVSHKILTKLSAEEAQKEIAESKKNIEDNLKDAVIAFSYPNGNYNKDIIELVKSHGYAVAFSTENGHVSAADDPFTVKRINIHNDVTKNIPMFLSTILGIF